MGSEINDKGQSCKAAWKLSALLDGIADGLTLAPMAHLLPTIHAGMALLLMTAAASGVHATPAADSADGFLEFQSEPDGRCQILSEGGKLRVLYNRHDSRAIDYRLMRVFGAGHRQGRVVGTAPAGGERVPLGCTRVDGHPQDWQLERATFSP